MPVFALFFPVPLAIAATAVVHFANNIFKSGLMAQQADWRVVLQFSVTAAIAAMAGAGLLNPLSEATTRCTNVEWALAVLSVMRAGA